jgi:hypothetical protein
LRAAAKIGIVNRIVGMEESIKNAEITIQRDRTEEEIRALAARTHGGNYRVIRVSFTGPCGPRGIVYGTT